MKLKDRIKGLERIPARDLLPHPKNWRTHSREQRDALRGILAEVGIADALLVRRTKDGYQILDGHCRAEEAPDVEWPCLVVDLSDAEAEKLLVTHDPIGAMAQADADALRELLSNVETESEALKAVFDGLEVESARQSIDLDDLPTRADSDKQTKAPSGNSCWFAVTYYENEEIYQAVRESLEAKGVLQGSHIDAEWFADVVLKDE